MAMFVIYGTVVAFLTISGRISMELSLILVLFGLNLLALVGRSRLLPDSVGNTLRVPTGRQFVERVLLFVIWSTAGVIWTFTWALIVKHKMAGDTPIVAALTFGPSLFAIAIAAYYFVKAVVPRS